MKKYLALLIALTLTAPALAIDRNVSGQKVTVLAWDSATGRPKTGDAANITAYVQKDDGTVTVLADTSAAEQDATNAKGQYIFDLAQAETNAIKLTFSAKSSTSGVDVYALPAVEYTKPAGMSAATTAFADTSGTTTLLSRLSSARGGYLDYLADTTYGLAAISQRIPEGRTYYVDDTDGAGDLGTFAAPYDSWTQLTGAVTLVPGDTVHFRAGTYARMTISVVGLTIEGDGDTTIFTDTDPSAGTIAATSMHNMTFRNLKIVSGTGGGWGLTLTGCHNVNLSGVWCDGGILGACKIAGGAGSRIINCRFTGKADALNVFGQKGNFISGGYATTDGSATNSGAAALWCGSSSVTIAENFAMTCTKVVATEHLLMGLEVSQDDANTKGAVFLKNCPIVVRSLNPSNTGRVACIGPILADQVVIARAEGCPMLLYNNGSGTGYYIEAPNEGSSVQLRGCVADRTKFLAGTNADGSPTIIDEDQEIKSTSPYRPLLVNSSGKTSPADDSITASTFDESTAFPLKSADTGSTQVARKGSEDVTLTDIEAGSGGGGTGPDIATESVGKDRIFTLVHKSTGLVSEDRKTIIAGSPANTYAIDFKNDAGTAQKVYTITSVEIISGTADGLEFGTAERDGGTQARVRITGIEAGNYTVRCEGTYVGGAGFKGDILIKVVE